MNLVFDIGNTHIKTGLFDRGKLLESQRMETITGDALKWIMEKYSPEAVLVSSVGKNERSLFDSAGKDLKTLIFLDHTVPMPLKISYATPETLGHDRIAAAAGARKLLPGTHLLIIDLGTAITIDFVTPQGEFKGGNISPGLQTRFKSLHDQTARLPLVRKNAGFPDFGTDTQSAIAAGVQQGIIFELNGYIQLYESRYPGCKFIVTGGDAEFFVHKLKKPIFAFPDLVLTGLNHILEFNSPETRNENS
jgi:type III pantothenate kinase